LNRQRDWVVYVAILGIETCWLAALLFASNKAVSDRLSVSLLLCLLPISWAISEGLRLLRWPKAILTALSWLVWPAAMLLMIKIQLFRGMAITDVAWLTSLQNAFAHIFQALEPALLIFVTSILLWWIGRRMAYVETDSKSIATEFQFSLILLVIIFFSNYELQLEQASSLPITLVFFTLSLIGLAFSQSSRESWLTNWRQGQWSALLFISVAAILLLGLLISALVTPDFLHLVVRGFQWIWGQIERLFSLIGSLLPNSTQEGPPPLPNLPPVDSQPDVHPFGMPAWLKSGLTVGWAILALGLVALAAWRIASEVIGWIHKRASNSGAEIESLKGAFKTDFLNWLKKVFYTLFKMRIGLPALAKTKCPSPEVASVRQLYRELLVWAARDGYSRKPAQTPVEFESELEQVIPERTAELGFITWEYMRARYGSDLPSAEVIAQLKQRWAEVKQKELKPKPVGESGRRK
jgi:hypothetical protein